MIWKRSPWTPSKGELECLEKNQFKRSNYESIQNVEGIVGQNGNFKSNVNMNLEICFEQNDFLDYQESSTTLKNVFTKPHINN